MMLSDTQIAVRDSVRAFAQKRISPHAADFEAQGGYPAALFEELGGTETYGGPASDFVSYALALAEIEAADGALSTIISIQNSIMGRPVEGRHGGPAPPIPPRSDRRTHDRSLRFDRGPRRLGRIRHPNARIAEQGRLAHQWRQAVHHLRKDRRPDVDDRHHRHGGRKARPVRFPRADRPPGLHRRESRAQAGTDGV